jgi:hypothetical protein
MILNAQTHDARLPDRRAPREVKPIYMPSTTPSNGAPLEEKCAWMRKRQAQRKLKAQRKRAAAARVALAQSRSESTC